MAELQQHPYALSWGRLPDGRFCINVAIMVTNSDGKVAQVPVQGYILDKTEEDELVKSLTGLHLPR